MLPIFENCDCFPKVPSALCWMPKHGISHREMERVCERFAYIFFLLSPVVVVVVVFFNVPSGARTIEPKALNIIILSFDSTTADVDGEPRTLTHTHRIENLHNNFKIDPNAFVSSGGSWFNTLNVVDVVRSSHSTFQPAGETFPFISIYVENWQMKTMDLLPPPLRLKNSLSAFKCNFILTKNYAYNKLPSPSPSSILPHSQHTHTRTLLSGANCR